MMRCATYILDSRGIKYFFICVFLCCTFLPSSSQVDRQKKVDSLKQIIQNPSAPADTNKVSALCNIAYLVYGTNHNAGLDYAKQAYDLAKKIGWKKGTGNALGAMGTCYWAKSDYVSALACYQNELEIFTAEGDEYNIIRSYIAIGTANFAEGYYDKALAYYNKAVAMGANSNNKLIRYLIYSDGGALNFISMTYQTQHDLIKAAEYCQMAIDVNEKEGNKQDASRILSHLANINTAQKNYAEAEKNITHALAICKSNNDILGQGRCYEVLAYIQTSKGDYKAALLSYKQAIKVNTLADDKEHVANNYAFMAYAYMQMDDSYNEIFEKTGYTKAGKQRSDSLVANAAASLEKAIAIALPLSSLIALQDYEFQLYRIYERQGNYAKAIEAFKKYDSFKDSVSNSDVQKKFSEQLLEYEYGKEKDSLSYINKLQQKKVLGLQKERELSLLKQRQLILYSVAGIMLTGFLTSFLVYRNRLQRINLKNELAEEKSARLLKQTELNSRMNDVTFSALRSQMNPHFIFNCLNSIKLYTEQNNTEAASEYLSKFSKLIRSTLDSAHNDSISLAAELDLLKLYLEMEAIRFKEKLQYTITVQDGIDTEFIDIPPLIIQPYVENAIWHGLMQKQQGGSISINVSMHEQMLVITVEDDGIGRVKAAELKSKTAVQHKSFGTKLAAERIALINEKYKTSAQVIIDDLYDSFNAAACGTRITIKLPVK